MATRQMINCPEWVRVVDANVPAGAEYWKLTRVEYWDDQHSGGTHHIYVQEPHDAQQRMLVSNGQERWPVPLEKPQNEPAGNFAMWAHNTYSVEMEGLPSDRVEGLHMPLKHHVSYLLWWERGRKEPGDGSETGTGTGTGTDPQPEIFPIPGQTLAQALLAMGDARQVLRFNPDAALQQAIFRAGFVPNSSEFTLNHEGKSFVAQRAERLSDGEVRVFYVQQGDWSNVQSVKR